MKKSVVALGIFALIFAIASIGLTVMVEGYFNVVALFTEFISWFGFSTKELLAFIPIGLSLLLFIILFILIFTRHRVRKLFNGLNLLFVGVVATLIAAKVIHGEIMLIDASNQIQWSAFTDVVTYYQIGSVLLAALAYLFAFIAAMRSIFAHDYKPKYAHVKLKDPSEIKKPDRETPHQLTKKEKKALAKQQKIEATAKKETEDQVKVDTPVSSTEPVKEEVIVEAKDQQKQEPQPEPKPAPKVEEKSIVTKEEPKEEVKEVVVRRIIEERVVVPVRETPKVDTQPRENPTPQPQPETVAKSEEKPLYNFQKKRTTPKPTRRPRPEPVLGTPQAKLAPKKEQAVASQTVNKPKPTPKPLSKEEAKVKEDETTDTKGGPSADGKRVYHLNKRDSDNKWTIRFAGGQRVIKLCDTQKEAIEYVEALCANNGGTYLVHSSRGKSKGRIRKAG